MMSCLKEDHHGRDTKTGIKMKRKNLDRLVSYGVRGSDGFSKVRRKKKNGLTNTKSEGIKKK